MYGFNWKKFIEEQGVKIIIDEYFTSDFCFTGRRSYYRMRGKPVTPNQAAEIIARTEHIISGEYVGGIFFQ